MSITMIGVGMLNAVAITAVMNGTFLINVPLPYGYQGTIGNNKNLFRNAMLYGV